MDIDKFLKHPFIKLSAIAERLYPDLPKKSAAVQLTAKLNGYKGNKAPRKLSEQDKTRLAEIWEEMKKEIDVI